MELIYPLEDLPSNVHLQGLRARDGSTDDIGVRFMHTYEAINEAAKSLAQPAEISLDNMFVQFKIATARASSISFNNGTFL
jgi:hypothetical protein